MSASVQTILTVGFGGIVVDAECQLTNGLPNITIVGLGNKAIDEARERVRSAFASSQLAMPRKRITVNLAPADIPKESTSLDLAIALSILVADGQVKPEAVANAAFIGELGLDGSIRSVRGLVGKILAGHHHSLRRFFIPVSNMAQAQLVPNTLLTPVRTLTELVTGLRNPEYPSDIATGEGIMPELADKAHEAPLSEVVGQALAKRGLEIAAAGGHNIFLNGPPGTGKSMLARALPSILPPLKREEILEITQLHSLVSGNYDALITHRPFRAPHHSASQIAIVGGGNHLRPGEISLAHRGVLFFDEFPEFGRGTIEVLRQPLEERTITIARAKDSVTYPANFIFVATANPCPCGFFGTAKTCSCPAHAVAQYRQKLSGPIMDRVDLYAEVQEIDHARLLGPTEATNDDVVRSRVAKARGLQAQRFNSTIKLNADMTNRDIKAHSNLTAEATDLLNNAAQTLDISARSYMRMIKVARTIADLEESPTITTAHIAEALQYRHQTTPILA